MTKKELLEQLEKLSDPDFQIPDLSNEELDALERSNRAYSLSLARLRDQYETLTLRERMQKDISAEENL